MMNQLKMTLEKFQGHNLSEDNIISKISQVVLKEMQSSQISDYKYQI